MARRLGNVFQAISYRDWMLVGLSPWYLWSVSLINLSTCLKFHQNLNKLTTKVSMVLKFTQKAAAKQREDQGENWGEIKENQAFSNNIGDGFSYVLSQWNHRHSKQLSRSHCPARRHKLISGEAVWRKSIPLQYS